MIVEYIGWFAFICLICTVFFHAIAYLVAAVNKRPLAKDITKNWIMMGIFMLVVVLAFK